MNLQVALTLSLLGLTLLLWAAVSAYAAWIETRVCNQAIAACRVEQQRQARVVDCTYTLLLKKAYKPRDWRDDRAKTQVSGERDFTKFDWRTPSDE